MKKTLTLAFFAAVCAAGTVVAAKIQGDPEWALNDNTKVTGTATFVKNTYCPGANSFQCAVNLDGSGQIIRKS
jgi:hypothetical protein